MEISRSSAEALDRDDPLARFREHFAISERYAAYMDGNSLGRPPKRARELVEANIDTWTESMILGWRDWIKVPRRLGDKIATGVIGAQEGEVLVSETTTVSLYKASVAAVEARADRSRIVTSDDNFPTDIYVLESIARQFGKELVVLEADPVHGLDLDLLAAHLDDDTALVSLSHLAYKSGALLDLAKVSQMVDDAGAMILWDLSHSAGSVPINLGDTAAHLAVGCTYKYLNGGPGCPAFTYVPKALQGTLQQPIWGWFGHRAQFDMGVHYEPAESIDQFLTGAQPMLSLVSLEAGLDLIAEAGIEQLYAKSQRLTDFFVDAVDAIGSPDLGIASPRDADRRGSHVTVSHPQAKQVVRALIARGVIPDYRPPNLMRFGPAPLYSRYVDMWQAADTLATIVAEGVDGA